MDPSPPKLAPETVDAFLQYIIPPVQLATNPIPSPLLSLPLLQRHHYLNISPEENLADYLIWPSPDQPRILDILHDLPIPAPAEELSTRYSGDQETLFSHVHLRSTPDTSAGVRLVFQWDPHDNAWKFHNISLMPFPPNSYHALDDVWGIQGDGSAPHVVGDGNEEDAYWAAYGQEDVDEERVDAPAIKHDHANSEDAYWAQYSNVHGSGDSTIPSPVPEKRKPGPYMHFHEDEADGDGREPIAHSFSSLRPSKHAVDLTDRLHALSSRLDILPSHDDVPELTEESTSDADSPTVHSPEGPYKFEAAPSSDTPYKLEEPSEVEAMHDADVALKEAIRGMYALWKMGKGDTRKSTGGTTDEFLDIVKQVIHEA